MTKELRRVYFVVGIVTVILIGITIFLIGISDGWLGFFGGYLGILIGICGTLYIVTIQLNKENDTRKQEQDTSTFFSLLQLYTRQQEKLLQEENYFSTILADIKSEITIKLEREAHEFICKNKLSLLRILSNMKKEIDSYIAQKEIDLDEDLKIEFAKIKNKEVKFSDYIDENSSFLDSPLFNELAYLFDRSIEIESDCKELDQDFDVFVESSLVDYITNSFNDFYLVNDSYLEFSNQLTNDIEKFMKKLSERDISELTELERIELTQIAFERYYKSIMPYFRTFYQVLKFINEDSSWNESTKINYLEILRANVTEAEMLVLFYYSAYTFEGEELFDELKRTTFFGEPQELLENVEPTFFSKSDLLWEADDLAIMRENEQLLAENDEIRAKKSMMDILFSLFFRK